MRVPIVPPIHLSLFSAAGSNDFNDMKWLAAMPPPPHFKTMLPIIGISIVNMDQTGADVSSDILF